MSLDERKRTVRDGYDRLAPRFAAWAAAVEGDPWERFLTELTSRLDDGARVLDLGCGSGDKTRRLAGRFDVLGVDLSEKQLGLARLAVPDATFQQGDFAGLNLAESSFDAVTAFYSITHVPREEHPALFGKIARWLRSGGLFLASLSANGTSDWTEEWLGVKMFFSGYDADTNRRLLRESGFRLLVDEVVTMREPDGEATFLWVLAEKPS
jgi:cyclopropane fatty-acyl-phospholipid synthase-like methyltransferase